MIICKPRQLKQTTTIEDAVTEFISLLEGVALVNKKNPLNVPNIKTRNEQITCFICARLSRNEHVCLIKRNYGFDFL